MNSKPVYVAARVKTGQIVPLRKDCECVTHTGPHWLHVSDCARKANAPLLAQGSALSLRGFAIEESMRLGELRRAFEREGIETLLTAGDVDLLRAGGEAIDLSRPGLRPAIKRLIALSYNDAERVGPGWRTWAGFVACWEWCQVRLSGRAGDKHERFYAKHGAQAYYTRINKVRAACGFAPIKGAS